MWSPSIRVQICTYALPLITFPYLARVLGPAGWGSVVFAQAIGVVIAVFVEYGFDLSASREASRHRDEPRHLSELISGVLGAKAILAALLCVWSNLLPPLHPPRCSIACAVLVEHHMGRLPGHQYALVFSGFRAHASCQRS